MPGPSSPAGMAPNMLNTVVLVFTLIAGLVVFLRLFTRGLLLRKAGAEDAWISFAMVLSIGLTVTIAVQVQNGLGIHIYELTPAMMVGSLKSFWASVWIYNLSLAATKVSILTQYLRVFPVPRFRIVCFIVLGVVTLYGIWTFFGSIFLCFPVAFFWDKTITSGKCLNQEAVWFTNATVNIVQDVAILFLPMPVLRSLDIPRRQKRALIIVFGLGGIVCLVSVIRLQTLVSISNSTDPTYDNPPAAMLSAIETNVGIICACLPSMRPLLATMMPAYFSDGSQYTNKWKQDEEQYQQTKHISSSTRPYTSSSTGKGGHSRSNSASSHPLSSNERSLSPGSHLGKINQPYSPSAYSYRSTGNFNHFQPPNGSGTGVHTLGRSETELQYMYQQQAQLVSIRNGLSLDNGHQHPLHPLRMSPYSPIAPKLPRLPENIAQFSPMDTLRPVRTPLFHKPLPITPFPVMPGNGIAPPAEDMSSTELIPQPLNLAPRPPH